MTREVVLPGSPALKPWVEYLNRLHEPDRSIMLHDLKVVVGLEV